jgi:hypothetical protein
MKVASASPPHQIDGADVVLFTPLDARHRSTESTRHIGGFSSEPVAGLAICHYPADSQFYLFSCTAAWGCITDTCHGSLQEAKAQAEFEHQGSMSTWLALAQPAVQADGHASGQ